MKTASFISNHAISRFSFFFFIEADALLSAIKVRVDSGGTGPPAQIPAFCIFYVSHPLMAVCLQLELLKQLLHTEPRSLALNWLNEANLEKLHSNTKLRVVLNHNAKLALKSMRQSL